MHFDRLSTDRLLALVGTGAGVVGAIAAILAAKYAKGGPTKGDLARVEQHTMETANRLTKVDERLDQQHNQDLLVSMAWRVSIDVKGQGIADEPFTLHFALKSADVELMSVELLNEAKMQFGSCECSLVGPQLFTCVVNPTAMRSWFSGGTKTAQYNCRLLQLRAHMKMEGRDAHRDFAVRIAEGYSTVPYKGRVQELTVEGSC
jgi:hypothetical protein